MVCEYEVYCKDQISCKVKGNEYDLFIFVRFGMTCDIFTNKESIYFKLIKLFGKGFAGSRGASFRVA